MTVLAAIVVVGVGSLVFRLAPLLGARWLSDRVSSLAGRAGVAVLAAIIVRAVALHQDPALPGAPAYAFLAVGIALLVSFTGRSVLLALGAGAGTYLALAGVTTLLA